MLENIPLIIYALCSAILILYGLHNYFIIFLFLRKRDEITDSNNTVETEFAIVETDAPAVLSQIPLYNELAVAERVIRSVASIDYPNHFIQVLDDSTDETVELVDSVVANLVAQGIRIETIRREDRSGYKAGALDYGLKLNDAPYIAIFDSDFIPPPDFLRRTIPHFKAREKCCVVQARWGHINADENAFTRAQSVGVNGHFVVEQVARSYNNYFLNFNGTAGVWSREAIADAGGWNADTLTEDLDLSYRAQLKGWKIHFLPNLVVPAELPPFFRAFRSQQFRWAKGSMQTAKKILPLVWKAEIPVSRKVEATFHLTHYSIHFCMLLQAILALPIILLHEVPFGTVVVAWFALPMALAMMGPSLLYLAAERWLDKEKGFFNFITRLPMLLLIGFGICLSNARACAEGIIGIKSPFVRTPKQGDNKAAFKDLGKATIMPMFELFMAAFTLLTAYLYYNIGLTGIVPFFLIYSFGFAMFGYRSLSDGRVKKSKP
ncbi:glycosyltransferase [Rubritalea sp.]|uniref:glycosyltransferase n=1 Tax=Rubritalea sp. TaxID=2109375 RepID=UPI003EF96A04